MTNLTDRIADFLIRRRNILLALGIIVAIISIVGAPSLEFDRSIQNMFAADDEYLDPYQDLTRVFGGTEAVLLVYKDPELLAEEGEGIDRAEEISNRISEIEGVAEVLSLATIDRFLRQVSNEVSFGLYEVAITSERSPAPAYRELFQNLTHSDDGQTAAIVCMLESHEQSARPRRDIIADIRARLKGLPEGYPDVLITGEPVMVADGFVLVEQDGRLLERSSTVLLALVILACFRSIRWVIIPVATVQFTLVFTQAVLAWSGVQLSMVSSMFSAIVTVIGVATVVHVIVRYREGRRSELEPQESLRRAIRILITPITWACLTDAAGFAALMFATIGPVQDFGLMMTIGSLLVLVAVALIVPGLALLPLPKPLRFLDIEPQRVWNESLLDQELARPLGWISRYPKLLSVLAVALGVLAIIGVSKSEVESDFTKNFRSDSELVTSYQFVETNLGGAGVWDVMIPAPKEITRDYLQRIDKFEQRLREEVVVEANEETRPGLTKVLSLSDALNASPVPLLRTNLDIMNERMPQLMRSLHANDPDDPEQWYFRIMLRSLERQDAQQKKQIIDAVETICREEFPPTGDEQAARPSGFFVLLAHLVDSVMKDQWKTFGIATLLIGLMMWIAFRQPFLAIAGMIPNLLIILLVLGSLGWLGVRINMGAAMIAAVSIGLSIDSSIHYITGYRRSRAEGLSVSDALASVQQRVGRALVFSTMALIAGFAVLCISEFVPTIYFGALVSLSMLGGLLGNLLILPLLLSLFSGKLFQLGKTNGAEPDTSAPSE